MRTSAAPIQQAGEKMRKSFEIFFAVTGVVVWIGAIPFALAAFGKESCSPAKTWSQRVHEWPEQARAARHKLELEQEARRHRIEAQAEADLNAVRKFTGTNWLQAKKKETR